MTFVYDSQFFNSINKGSYRSAHKVIPVVQEFFTISSVVDFGCGQGAWLKAWQDRGVSDVFGIDGDYVNEDELLIDRSQFAKHDLTQSINLGRKFDLVQSLEVAEHIPEEFSDIFIKNLVSCGPIIMFSAAVPGQGGTYHINEQKLDFWRGLFRNHGYRPVDVVRPSVLNDGDIETWYRYNTLVYLDEKAFMLFADRLAGSVIPENQPIRDVSPAWYQGRKMIIKHFPVGLSTALARAKGYVNTMKNRNTR